MNIAFSKLYKYCLKHVANLQTNLSLYRSQNSSIRPWHLITFLISLNHSPYFATNKT